MSATESRQIARDSLFVLVDLRLDGDDHDHRIKMRNLSAGGMLAEGSVKAARGMSVWVNLRNIGWVEGTVAWVQETRFGIAFRDEIDPAAAKAAPSSAADVDPFVVLRPYANIAGPARAEPLRKI